MHNTAISLVHCSSRGVGRAFIPDGCTSDFLLQHASLLSFLATQAGVERGRAERVVIDSFKGLGALTQAPVLLFQFLTIDRNDSFGVLRVAHLVRCGRHVRLVCDTCSKTLLIQDRQEIAPFK